jgi:hypothetical protein
MTYDAWKLKSPDDDIGGQAQRCELCGDDADCFDDGGRFLCADCMFDEACRDELEETGEFDENV